MVGSRVGVVGSRGRGVGVKGLGWWGQGGRGGGIKRVGVVGIKG